MAPHNLFERITGFAGSTGWAIQDFRIAGGVIAFYGQITQTISGWLPTSSLTG
jgi:hypothetical protein